MADKKKSSSNSSKQSNSASLSLKLQMQGKDTQIEKLNGQIRRLEEKLQDQNLQNGNLKRQVQELEQFVLLMSNSALGTELDSQQLKEQLQKGLKKMDSFLQENFRLKKEIACEKKRYIDLMNAFMELRNSKRVEDDLDGSMHSFSGQQNDDTNNQQIKTLQQTIDRLNTEKSQLHSTVINLSHEVEYLSSKNIQFLNDLKRKDPIYQCYNQTVDELDKLREAHACLIGMIKNHDLHIKERSASVMASSGAASSSGFGGRKNSIVAEHSMQNSNINVSDLLSCGLKQNSRQNQARSPRGQQLREALMKNEYLQIIQDPEFKNENINFLQSSSGIQ